jgi:O-antigen/teichoic acid export membrane protein
MACGAGSAPRPILPAKIGWAHLPVCGMDGATRRRSDHGTGASVVSGAFGVLQALRDPGSLTRRAAEMALWRGGGHALSLALRLGSNLVMTRLLAPEAFGLIGLVFAIHTGLMMVTDVGLRPAVMRSAAGDDPDFLRTAWTVQIVQHGAVATLLVLGSGALLVLQRSEALAGSSVYADPALPGVLVVSCAMLLAQGAVSMNLALAERGMTVGRVVAIDLATQIVTAVAMIAAALVQPTIWALVIGGVIGSVMRLALTHLLLAGPRMGLRWRPDVVSEIWESGKWLIGASTLGFFAGQGDRLILAALLDARTFGLYAIATVWVSAARDGINAVMRSTSFATVSEVGRLRPDDLARIFGRLREAQDVLGGLAYVAVLVGGPLLISLLYTEAYAAAGPMMSILAIQIPLARYNMFTDILLRAGDTRSIARITLIVCVTMLTIPPAAFFAFGPTAAILAIGLNGFWSAPVAIACGARHVPVDLRREHLVLACVVIVGSGCLALLGPTL